MLREIKIQQIEEEDGKKVLAGFRLPCHCGKGTRGLCGSVSHSEELFEASTANLEIS